MSRQVRAAQTRSAKARPPVGGGVDFRGRLHIDPGLLPPGVEAQWVREECLGEYDEGNVQANLEDRGFRPLTTEEAPGLAPPVLPGRERSGNLIRRGGLVLMVRPKEFGVEERQARKASDEATLRAVNKELDKGLDGKNFQRSPDSAVHVSLDRGDGVLPKADDSGGQPFSDA